MSVELITKCEACRSEELELKLDLGFAPPPGEYWSQASVAYRSVTYPVRLLRCRKCTLVQSAIRLDPEASFPKDYGYTSGTTKSLVDHFEQLARDLEGTTLGKDDLVVDIGANDGSLLKHFTCRTVGVEPTDQAQKYEGTVYQEFFSEKLAQQIVESHGQAKVVTACNVLAHVPDIHEVLQCVRTLLADDGIFIAENHDLRSIVDGLQWDTLYHEHFRYYDPMSFGMLLGANGFRVISGGKIPTHGGSFRVYAVKDDNAKPLTMTHALLGETEYDWKQFQKGVASSRHHLRGALSALRMGGERVTAIGATARATTIIHACGLTVDDIEAVLEVPGSDKIGTFMPGTGIPVRDEQELFSAHPPGNAVLFSWHLADKIIPSLRGKGFVGNIIIPLPKLTNNKLSYSNFMRHF